jgi:hypothetical protein
MEMWNANPLHNTIKEPTALEKRWHRLTGRLARLGAENPAIFLGLDFVEPTGDEPASANRAR